jgi:uncharacterized protein with PIN domain
MATPGRRAMIEIIKKGPKDITTCPKCGCKFSYEKEDIKSEDYAYKSYKEYVICPQCNQPVILLHY